MTLLLLDMLGENPESVGIFSAVGLLLIRELRALATTLALKKRETDIERKLTELLTLHKDPDSMVSTYGFRDRLKNLEDSVRKIYIKCQMH